METLSKTHFMNSFMTMLVIQLSRSFVQESRSC